MGRFTPTPCAWCASDHMQNSAMAATASCDRREAIGVSPFPCPRLRLGDLFARHAGGDTLAGLAGILVAGRGGKV